MSFAAPLVLIGLVALPALAIIYSLEQRRRARLTAAFVSAPLMASVAPQRPGWRRHAPYVVLGLGLVALIVAIAKPQYTVTRPVSGATVMFANDVSDSMTSTDVKPSRLGAAKRAATTFVKQVSPSAQIGSIEFWSKPVLLQSPTRDHTLTRQAIAKLKAEGEGTVIGNALQLALNAIKAAPKIAHKRPPGVVILISDGATNGGVNPITVARQAKHDHIKIYTISIGTAHGTIRLQKGGRTVTSQVPVDPTELRQIATASGGHAYRAADSATVHAIYSHLAAKLGYRHVHKQLVAEVAALGLVLLLTAGAMSLRWFGQLA